MIKVYTKYDCVQCDTTKRYLDTNNVEYETINVEDDPEAYNYIVSLGFKSVPVVISDTDKWAGFKLDHLRKVAQEYHIEKNKAS